MGHHHLLSVTRNVCGNHHLTALEASTFCICARLVGCVAPLVVAAFLGGKPFVWSRSDTDYALLPAIRLSPPRIASSRRQESGK